MSKLTDEQIKNCLDAADQMYCPRDGDNEIFKARAIESIATEPLLQRIAHLEATASANYGRGHADAHSMLSERIADLEQRNSDLHEDVQRFKKHALNEKAARLELERQLEEALKDAKPCPTCESLARTVMLDQTGKA